MSLKPQNSFSVSETRESIKASTVNLLDKFVYYSLLALILLTTIQKGDIGSWRESVFAFIVFILTAVWFIEGILNNSWFVKEHLALLPLLLITALAFLQYTGILFSADRYDTWLAVIKFLSITLFAALLLSHLSSTKRLNLLVHLIILVGLISSFFGIWRQLTQSDVMGFFPHNTQGAEFGQFINRNHFAFLMEMTLGLALGVSLFAELNRLIKILYLAVASVIFIALVMTTSRGALLSTISLLIFVALMFFFTKETKIKKGYWKTRRSKFKKLTQTLFAKIIFIGCLSAVSVFSIIWFGGQPLIQRWKDVPKEIELKNQTGESRVEIWSATWRLIKDYPIAGSSFGAFGTAITPYHVGTGIWTPQQAHNDYLELLAGTGVIGSMFAVSFLICVLRLSRKQLQVEDRFRRAVCLGASAGIFAVALHSFVDFGLHVTINAIVFMSLVVIAIVNFNENGSLQSA